MVGGRRVTGDDGLEKGVSREWALEILCPRRFGEAERRGRIG